MTDIEAERLTRAWAYKMYNASLSLMQGGFTHALSEPEREVHWKVQEGLLLLASGVAAHPGPLEREGEPDEDQ